MWWNRLPKTHKDFCQQRELPRSVDPGPLSSKEIREMTRIVFEPVSVVCSDLMFLFGTEKADYDFVAHLYHKQYAPIIIVNGLPGSLYYKTGVSLAQEAREELEKRGVPREAILVQKKSRNTLEDVIFGKRMIKKKRVSPKRILFVSKSHHSGRARRTLAKYFPETALHAATYNGVVEGLVLTREEWALHESTRARVYAEYLRIKRYTERGDISFQ